MEKVRSFVYVIQFDDDDRLIVADSWDAVQDIMLELYLSFDSVKISRCEIQSSLK